ncbi:MAG: hypothetical protein NZ845_05940 [Thermodesulfovibrio sp.]|nr:hypothetical protein [Thermodesulfovibrio sp.]MDW7972866.1 hypothetical protein [Thermodesulfovibrio sp.]
MTRDFKISLAIFIISTLLFLVSLKLKEPSFITQKEKAILEFPLPEIKIKERDLFIYGTVDNPFGDLKIAEMQRQPKEALKIEEASLPTLSFIYEGRNRYAVIGNSIVREGDSINGYQIKAIFKDRVLIRDRKGEIKWLRLENY